ncbi:hypothetical protein [Modestobacter sp. SYSU DS0875]
MIDQEELFRLYGPWLRRIPADAAALFAGYGGRWWIAGGWAVEAFTGVSRDHADIYPSIPRSDVADLHRHLAGRLDVWAADSGALRPVLDPAEEPVPMSCGNLWLRSSGVAPLGVRRPPDERNDHHVDVQARRPHHATARRHPLDR